MTPSRMISSSSSIDADKVSYFSARRLSQIFAVVQHSDLPTSRQRSVVVQLMAGLRLLATSLATLPRDGRHSAIQVMSPSLRALLLHHMEVQTSCSEPKTTPWISSEETIPRKRKCALKQLKRCTKSVRGSRVTAYAPSEAVRGICQIQTPWGLRFFARLTIAGVAISSRCFQSQQEAETCQTLLIELREALQNLRVSAHGDGMSDAVFESLRRGMESDLASMGVRFRATIDARRWVGRTLSSPQLSSLSEALVLRSKLEKAREQGWEALRGEWLECSQLPRRSARFGHTVTKILPGEARDRGHIKKVVPRSSEDDVSARHSDPARELRKPAAAIRVQWRVRRLISRLEKRFARVEAMAQKRQGKNVSRQRLVHSSSKKKQSKGFSNVLENPCNQF